MHLSRQDAGQAIRFLALGVANSVLSVALYWALQRVMPVTVAYTLAYLAGLTLSAHLNGRVVFRVRASAGDQVLVFVVFVVVFVVGLATVWVMQDVVGLPPVLSILCSVSVTAPLNYVASRAIHERSRRRVTAR